MTASVNNIPSRDGFPGSSFRHTPLEHVRTLFVSFVQGLFGAAPPGHYRWDPDEQKTEIVIRDENPIHVDKYGQRPCINFTIGRVQFYSLGMDDMYFYRFRDSQKTKEILVPGTTSVNVCARSDIETHNLAWVVSEHIWLLRELLLRKGFFELGRGIDISPPSSPGSIVSSDQADEWYCSSVSIPWQFARLSSFTPLGKRVVSNIVTSLEVNRPAEVGSKGWPASGVGLPVNIKEYPPPSFAPDSSDVYGGTPDPSGSKSNPLPKQPHPLNPAKMVVVRSVYPNRAGVRPPSMNGSTLPIVGQSVEES